MFEQARCSKSASASPVLINCFLFDFEDIEFPCPLQNLKILTLVSILNLTEKVPYDKREMDRKKKE